MVNILNKSLPIIFIVIVWLIFAHPVFLNNKIAYPSDYQVNSASLWNQYEEYWGPVKNPAMPDVVGQIYPWKKFTIDSLKDGQLPFWNPYSFSGTPHLANYQSSTFSITNIFYFIFDFKNAWSLAVIIQPLLAGIFTYFLIRSLRLSREAGLIAAVSFMFCGFITTWMNYTTLALAISFLPLALLSIEKYLIDKRFLWLIILSISIPLSFFSGHFQTGLYLGIFVYGYIIFKLILNKNIKEFFYLNVFYFLGLLVASPQLFPSIEFYLYSFRSSNFEKISPLPFTHLPTILAPDFYGNPVTRNNFSLIYAELASYAGVIPFFLALFALSKRNKNAIFFIITAITALVFSLDTPILDLIVRLQIPVISTASLSRILVIFSFSIAVLSAFGFDLLIKSILAKEIKKILSWILTGFVIFALIWIFVLTKTIDLQYYPIAKNNLILPTALFIGFIFAIFIGFKKSLIRITILLIILLVTFEMLRFAIKWQPFESKDFAFPTTPIISKLTSLDNTFRTHASYGGEASVFYKLPLTDGYDPLYINRYGEFVASLESGKIKSSSRYVVALPINTDNLPKVIDFLAIKNILIKKSDLNQPWVFPIQNYPDKKFKKIYEEDRFLIYENQEVLPKAYLLGDYEIISEDQKIINKILDEDFDLEKSVVLEKDPNIDRVEDFEGSVSLLNYEPNKINIESNSENDGILVISDNFYPGWKAKINGEETEILRANYTFRGIVVPKGDNKIEIYYFPDSFKWGVAIAMISITSIGLILLIKWYTTKKVTKKTKKKK